MYNLQTSVELVPDHGNIHQQLHHRLSVTHVKHVCHVGSYQAIICTVAYLNVVSVGRQLFRAAETTRISPQEKKKQHVCMSCICQYYPLCLVPRSMLEGFGHAHINKVPNYFSMLLVPFLTAFFLILKQFRTVLNKFKLRICSTYYFLCSYL